MLAKKPLLTIVNKASSAISILKEYGLQTVYDYQDVPKSSIIIFLKKTVTGNTTAEEYNKNAVKKYSAANMALKQCELFNKVVNG